MPQELAEILALIDEKQRYINAQLNLLKSDIERRMNEVKDKVP